MEQSLIQLIFNMINLLSILFGLNVASILIFVLFLGRKFSWFKWQKEFRLFILLICLTGFIIHNIYIFKSIVNEKLIHNEYFKKLENYNVPNVLLCLDLGKFKWTDPNHKLTLEYLEKVTSIFRFKNFIDEILYFNKTHINLFTPNSSRHSSPEISTKTYFFLNFKCFEIHLKIKFNQEDFYITRLKNIVEIHFNKIFVSYFDHFYFLYRKSDSLQLSDIIEYRIERRRDGSYIIYEIDFESIEVEREDKFELLKNPMSLFRGKVNLNDVTDYLQKIKLNFKKLTNRTTRNIFLKKNNLNLEVDDDLFYQFYLQVC